MRRTPDALAPPPAAAAAWFAALAAEALRSTVEPRAITATLAAATASEKLDWSGRE
jgi:hypothetical protein